MTFAILECLNKTNHPVPIGLVFCTMGTHWSDRIASSARNALFRHKMRLGVALEVLDQASELPGIHLRPEFFKQQVEAFDQATMLRIDTFHPDRILVVPLDKHGWIRPK